MGETHEVEAAEWLVRAEITAAKTWLDRWRSSGAAGAA